MPDETCDRGCDVDDSPTPDESASEPETTPESDEDRWIDEPSTVDGSLPDDVGSALGRFVGGQPPETLGDAVAAIRRRFGGGSIGVDDLCYADEPTAHRGLVDGEAHHFECFYDAVVLAELIDSPATIRTESPDGTEIRARATGTGELSVTPAGAAMSFGIATDATPPVTDDRTPEEAYAVICPYVKAFPNRAAYEAWAARVPAATVGLPLANATEIAALFAA